jgi:S-adenosylmethionine-diacylglycerol 3-amino-3-carboxypropyl transferase
MPDKQTNPSNSDTANGETPKKGRLGLDKISKAWFNLIHRNNLVYNTCWEDPRLDEIALELTPKDNVLVITSAGCNALDYAIQGVNHVYAIDMNPRQNAVLELKQTAIRQLDYDEFFQMFGRGRIAGYREIYKKKIRPHLSHESRKIWDRHKRYFLGPGQAKRPSFYYYGSSGMFAWMIRMYVKMKRLQVPVDKLLAAQTTEEQKEIYAHYNLKEKLWAPFLKWAMKRDATLAMLGVPRAQRQQLDRDYPGGILQFVIDSLEYVFTELPLKDNYFWRVYLTGSYTPDCCPEYLKQDNFNKLKSGLVDRVTTHTDSVLDFLNKNNVDISRYVLLDHMDWLAEVKPDILRQEWNAMVNRARPDTRFIWRSAGLKVEFVDPITVEVNNQKYKMGDLLKYNQELANKLHPTDRVHTYGSFYIADLNKPT